MSADRVMTPPSKALLPDGFRDRLGEEAVRHDHTVATMLSLLGREGYERVRPPLVEYEESFKSIWGSDLPMFRLMDPETQRVMALRADMTPQIARIAMTRFHDAPRPVRLSYAGDVVRFKGSHLRPTRQYGQLGAEVIGEERVEADAEVILMALALLKRSGVSDLSVDLTLPPLSRALVSRAKDESRGPLVDALSNRDADSLSRIGETGAILASLMACAGPVDAGLDALSKIELPDDLAPYVERLIELVTLLKPALDGVQLTLDLTETAGFEYKTGIGFAFFAGGSVSELGRGGRYKINHLDGVEETAVGFSFYMDRVIPVVDIAVGGERVLVLPDADLDLLTDALKDKVLIRVYDQPDSDVIADQMALERACLLVADKSGLRAIP